MMATYVLDRDERQRAIVSFDELWEHYLATGYIYPEKAGRLAPYMPAIQDTWPRLMRGPDTLFQLYTGRIGDHIGATHSVFRDTSTGMTMQHASSNGDPAALLACMRAELAAYPSTGCGFLGTYYRPENRWTSRICDVVSQEQPAEHLDTRTREFLTWSPDGCAAPEQDKSVVRISADEAKAATALVTAAHGELRAESLDLVAPTSPELTRIYAQAGAKRHRLVWGAYREGELAGLAVRYWGSPINSGLLCQRAEIIIHPDLDANSSAAVTRALARTVQQNVQPSDYLIPLLIDSPYAEAAADAGFQDTGRQYSHALWRMSCGVEYGVRAIDTYYQRVRRQADRLSARMARVV
jgi:hypothetical protein